MKWVVGEKWVIILFSPLRNMFENLCNKFKKWVHCMKTQGDGEIVFCHWVFLSQKIFLNKGGSMFCGLQVIKFGWGDSLSENIIPCGQNLVGKGIFIWKRRRNHYNLFKEADKY